MRLCLIGPTHLHIYRWGLFFARRGHQVDLLTRGTDPVPPEIRVHRLALDGRRGLLALVRAARPMLAAIAPDLVHAHWMVVDGWLPRLCRVRRYLVTPWGSDVFQLIPGRARARLLTFAALRGAARVTGSSQALLDAAVRLGAPRSRCRLVRWGVETARFHPGVSSAALLRRFGLEEALVVVNPRGPEAIYEPALAVEAIARARSYRPSLTLAQITTPGTPAHAALAARAAAHGGGVRLLPRLPHEEMPALMAGAAASLSLARTDSTSVSLLEAMASGCVPVAADIAANRECIVDGRNGLLVPPGDAGALAAAVVRAVDDQALRRRCLEENPRWVRDHAEFATHMEAVERMYTEVIG